MLLILCSQVNPSTDLRKRVNQPLILVDNVSLRTYAAFLLRTTDSNVVRTNSDLNFSRQSWSPNSTYLKLRPYFSLNSLCHICTWSAYTGSQICEINFLFETEQSLVFISLSPGQLKAIILVLIGLTRRTILANTYPNISNKFYTYRGEIIGKILVAHYSALSTSYLES